MHSTQAHRARFAFSFGISTMVLSKSDVDIAGVGGKPSFTHSEDTADHGDSSGLTREELEFVRDYPDDKRKKILRKVDLRLVPCLTLLYLLAFIDRGNIGEFLLSLRRHYSIC